jgi:hypothetical protein
VWRAQDRVWWPSADACNFIGYLVNDAGARQRKLDILREHRQALTPYEEIERTLYYWLHITREAATAASAPAAIEYFAALAAEGFDPGDYARLPNVTDLVIDLGWRPGSPAVEQLQCRTRAKSTRVSCRWSDWQRDRYTAPWAQRDREARRPRRVVEQQRTVRRDTRHPSRRRASRNGVTAAPWMRCSCASCSARAMAVSIVSCGNACSWGMGRSPAPAAQPLPLRGERWLPRLRCRARCGTRSPLV